MIDNFIILGEGRCKMIKERCGQMLGTCLVADLNPVQIQPDTAQIPEY